MEDSATLSSCSIWTGRCYYQQCCLHDRSELVSLTSLHSTNLNQVVGMVTSMWTKYSSMEMVSGHLLVAWRKIENIILFQKSRRMKFPSIVTDEQWWKVFWPTKYFIWKQTLHLFVNNLSFSLKLRLLPSSRLTLMSNWCIRSILFLGSLKTSCDRYKKYSLAERELTLE